jgi:glycine cleavage system aminomethyltransferase T
VLELSLLDATIVACHATATALDTWSAAAGTFVARIARDEAWAVGPRSDRCGMVQAVEGSLRALERDCLIVDQTDGWTGWSVRGSDAAAAMARLSVIPMPAPGAGFHQGAVAGIPAKVLAHADGFHVFVPSPVGHHLRDRLLEAGADLAPTMGPTRPFDARR